MILSLLPYLQTQTLILTPNQRLAATALKRYSQTQIQQGRSCWPTPAIRPLSAFARGLWDSLSAITLRADSLPLTADQELILWEEILAEEPDPGHLLNLSDLAQQAKAAWTTLKLWRCDIEHPAFSLTENARQFQTWAQRFAQRCQEKGWLDNASLVEQLLEDLPQTPLPLPKHAVLLNFTELTPQYRDLLDICQKQGMQLAHVHLEAHQASFQMGLANEETEIQTMARWARKIHAQQPQASIGCITADLEKKREAILSAFSESFENPAAYNISAGRPLTAYPVIQQALELLRLPLKTLPFATLSALLHSPFLGDSETEMLARIQLDCQLRRRNCTTLTWSAFLEDCDSLRLKDRLQTYREQRRLQAASQRIGAWLKTFAQLLETLGWPGEQSLNSSEYQVIHRWLSLLKEMHSLDPIVGEITASKALHYLTVLAAQTYFQPETPEAPIQILGQLEGAGLPFDYLWVLGMDDTAWPPAPAPNPFIPAELQKTLRMPNASAERQLDYSRRLTQQYQQAAPLVFFSYAQGNEKEELRPSPLLANLEAKTLADLALPPLQSRLQTVFLSKKIEKLRDVQAPPLHLEEVLRGGAKIFETQGACPFKAFAEQRLHARALEEPQPGLAADQRGSVIHKALELFWATVKNQQHLLALSPEALTTHIQKAVTTALAKIAPFIHRDALYHKLVQQRLTTLLFDWLALEKTRPPFSVVAVEQKQEFRIENYTLSLRIDRIDELATGERLLIDYKTRKNCDIADWFGERPDEPQLPLYCLTQQQPITGLAFAQVHATKMELKGIAQKDLQLAGIKTVDEKTPADAPTWEGQQEHWRLQLRQLFRDFQNGQATVDPKNRPKTCRYCDLKTVCRIHEDGAYFDDLSDS